VLYKTYIFFIKKEFAVCYCIQIVNVVEMFMFFGCLFLMRSISFNYFRQPCTKHVTNTSVTKANTQNFFVHQYYYVMKGIPHDLKTLAWYITVRKRTPTFWTRSHSEVSWWQWLKLINFLSRAHLTTIYVID
jgi:hypothetical protein